MMLRGHNALARDVERWAMNRQNQLPPVEGLNEAGEAPPPYKSNDTTAMTQDPVDGNTVPAACVTVPPRALSRDETEHARLPDYFEAIKIEDNSKPELARSVVQHDYTPAENSTP